MKWFVKLIFLIIVCLCSFSEVHATIFNCKGRFIMPYETKASESKSQLANFTLTFSQSAGNGISVKISDDSVTIVNSSARSMKCFDHERRAKMYELHTPDFEAYIFRPTNNPRTLILIRVLKSGNNFGKHIFLQLSDGYAMDSFFQSAVSSNSLSISTINSQSNFSESTRQLMGIGNYYVSH